MKFYPYKKRGGGVRSFSHPEGQNTKGFGVVLTWVLEVLTILKRGGNRKRFPPFKRGLLWSKDDIHFLHLSHSKWLTCFFH